MKKLIIIAIVIVIIVLIAGAIVLYKHNSCDKFSGNNYYGWGSKEVKKCREAGCNVTILEEVSNPELFDAGYEKFKCTVW
ncbi:hypothetical protein HN958_00185 [Candidatus Falkowbacteria bacterium]|jgi:uncharacterized protein YxeA|nr:hypothetical protein [Candidatus Falkowbacteria bacterium]MBT7006906.1 hypothetical protein [Candidatus Falkowbacteria bacterium]